MASMMIVTEYRALPGKRDALFETFERLLVHRRQSGEALVVWADSPQDHNVSVVVEYWIDAERFAELSIMPWYGEYVAAIDQLVEQPPVTTVSIPRLVEQL